MAHGKDKLTKDLLKGWGLTGKESKQIMRLLNENSQLGHAVLQALVGLNKLEDGVAAVYQSNLAAFPDTPMSKLFPDEAFPPDASRAQVWINISALMPIIKSETNAQYPEGINETNFREIMPALLIGLVRLTLPSK